MKRRFTFASCCRINNIKRKGIEGYIRMSDNGSGMSDKDKENLFTLFYRGRDEKEAKGHGFGMTLSQKIIHLHGGNIAVHSEQGKGTLFVVELPHV